MQPLQVASWVLTNGVPAVLCVIVAALGLVIRHLWQEIHRLQEARLDEMRAFLKATDALHDKIHTTTHDLGRLADYFNRDRRRE